jgi:CRP-like cAMP-binding protein
MRSDCRMSLAGVLEKEPFFAALSKRGRRNVLLHTTGRVLQPGELVFDEDERAEGLFFLVRGTVQLRRRAFGRTMIIGDERAPSTLVTIGLFDGGRNSMSAVATCRSEVHLLGRSEFDRLCTANLPSALRLLGLCCQRVRQTVSLIDVLACTSVRQRVARLIAEISETTGSNTVDLPLSQEQLAVRLGTVREVVFRNLRHLQLEGVIHFHRRLVVIDDLPRLQAVAGASMSERIFAANADPSGIPFLIENE